MTPLALIIQARGGRVEGSDRALDQGRTADKFAFLRARGVALFAQDGSGVTSGEQIVVTSAAVEETVPDVKAARAAFTAPKIFGERPELDMAIKKSPGRAWKSIWVANTFS